MLPLPIDAIRAEFEAALQANPCVVLEAPPGAGKTTRVPVWLLERAERSGDSGSKTSSGKILVLEPRRIAARASAERVASELGERCGGRVGYRVRFDEKVGPTTRVEFITEGILTRRFQSDAFLDGVSAVVLDEVHERSLHTDLALGFLKELLDVRDDLIVVIMSATLDGKKMSAFMRDAPVVKSEGRMFDVEISTLPAIKGRDERRLDEKVAAAVTQLLDDDDDDGGDILAFLPGAGDIARAQSRLDDRLQRRAVDVFPLFGSLPFAEQERALRRGKRRRVVLATNIAETSLTVDGVTAVVDSGLRKAALFDPTTGLDRLDVVKISQASATQRAGRAGRVAKGRVVRLYSDVELQSYHRFDAPELSTIDLAPVVLALCAFAASDPKAFDLLDPLPTAKVDDAVALLRLLNALDADGYHLTRFGRALADLPVHPRVGAVLLAGRANKFTPEAAAMAAVLSERDFVTTQAQRNMPHHDDDILYRADLLDDRPAAGLVDRGGVAQVRRVRTQLERVAKKAPMIDALKLPNDVERPLATLLLAGFPDRVCVQRSDEKKRLVMVGRRGVKRDGRTGVHAAKLLVAPAVFGGSRQGTTAGAKEGVLTMAAAIAPADLVATMPHLVREHGALEWDSERNAAVSVTQTLFADLVLKAHKEGTPKAKDQATRDQAASLVFEHARASRDAAFPLDGEPAQQIARLAFAATHLGHVLKSGESWPDVTSEKWQTELLEMACVGTRSFAELAKVDVKGLILGSIDWRLKSILDDKVPEKIEVPSGSHVRIDYEAALKDAKVPILAVRLQEVFGWEQTPKVAGVPVLMHLLAPNRRPVQVTQDLANFWDSTYAEVRKELRQRYPKHAWPEDPRSEPAQARPRRRRPRG